MTAERAGKLALDGIWGTLKQVRDQWVLLAFVMTALVWARDLYEQITDMPPQVAELREHVDVLGAAIARLDGARVHAEVDRSPALAFPGMKHVVEDGRPGGLVTVRFRPARWVRADCRPGTLAAYMIDAEEKWRSVDVDLVRLPRILETQDIAFGVHVPLRMAIGRAQLLIQITQDCGTHVQVDSSPRLHFRVLAPEAP